MALTHQPLVQLTSSVCGMSQNAYKAVKIYGVEQAVDTAMVSRYCVGFAHHAVAIARQFCSVVTRRIPELTAVGRSAACELAHHDDGRSTRV